MKLKSWIIVLLLTIPAFSILVQRGYFSMHDDLQTMRQMELDKCIHDGQIPCRWVLDMGYGYGYPLFNYYPSMPYFIGQIFRSVGFAYVDVVKMVGIAGFIVTALLMYALGKKMWGEYGGILASVLYTYAPYHSVDFYVRGAMNEFWAMTFYPATLLATLNLIETRQKKWIVLTALAVAGVMLSHNPMLMIFSPLLVVWCLFWIIKFKAYKQIFPLAISAAWAFGLAAFFTLPVVLEAKYVSLWTLTSGYFNYLAHFLDLRQIFLVINWGYGASVLGPNDTMSFALGYLQWILPLAALLVVIFSKKLRPFIPQVAILCLFAVFALFMTHSKSTEIWKLIKPLEFLQFPWRFLTVAVFSVSLAAGVLGKVLNKKLLALLILVCLAFNAQYFRPDKWYPNMTDAEKFSGHSWQMMITSGIFDYLPVWAPQPPADGKGSDINIVKGRGTYVTQSFKTNLQQYRVNIESPQATLELQTYYFPGWKIYVDGQEFTIDPKRDSLLGRMQVDVSKGSHDLVAKFTNTPVRSVGDVISVISWGLVLGLAGLWLLKQMNLVKTSI